MQKLKLFVRRNLVLPSLTVVHFLISKENLKSINIFHKIFLLAAHLFLIHLLLMQVLQSSYSKWSERAVSHRVAIKTRTIKNLNLG